MVAAPFSAVLGPAAGYNAFVAAAWAAGAWAMFRFVRDVVGDTAAALAAALLFALQPWPLSELVEGRPTQALLGLMVVFCHQLWRTGTQRGLRAPLLAGAALALLGYQYWYYAVFAGAAAVAHGVAAAYRAPLAAGGAKAVLARHALAAAVACALAAPVVVPMLAATAEGRVPGLLDVSRWSVGHTAPLTVEGASITLQEWQPFAGAFGYHVRGLHGEEFVPGRPAYALVAAALLALWVARPGRLRVAPILAMSAVAVAFATGPVVLVGGATLANPVYLTLVHTIPFLQRLWWPARAWAIPCVLLPVCAGALLHELRGRPRLRLASVAAAVGGMLAALHHQGLYPLPVWTPRIEAGYRCLAAETGGAVAEVPWGWSQRHLLAQAVHGHPLLGGMNERYPAFSPPELAALRGRNPLVWDLTTDEGFAPGTRRSWTAADVTELGALGYRWIAVQLDAFSGGDPPDVALQVRRTRLRASLLVLRSAFGPPVYADARMEIWAPWGGGSPCAQEPPAPDTRPLGRTEIAPAMDHAAALPVWR